jgi:hypothetical protein
MDLPAPLYIPTFTEGDHSYCLEGAPVPSVTKILGQFINVRLGELEYLVDTVSKTIFPAERFSDAALVGQAIHKGCAILAEGRDLAWDKIDESLVQPLQNYRQWLSDMQVKPVLIEGVVASRKWKFAGMPDLLAYVLGDLCLIDIKTGQGGQVGPQTAAYLSAFQEQYQCLKKIKRAVVYVPKDGSKITMRPLEDKRDLEYFRARLFQHRYHNGE